MMGLFEMRIRGFRLVDLVAVGLLVVLMLTVYLAKAMAGGQRAEIARVERQIAQERARVRLLNAEVAHLEQPSRIEALSAVYLGMGPVPADREATAEALPAPEAKPAKEKTP